MSTKAKDVAGDTWPIVDYDDPGFDDSLRRKIAEVLADPRPPVPHDEVFARLYARHASRT